MTKSKESKNRAATLLLSPARFRDLFLHGPTSAEVRSEERSDDELALCGNLHNFHATQIAHGAGCATAKIHTIHNMYSLGRQVVKKVL